MQYTSMLEPHLLRRVSALAERAVHVWYVDARDAVQAWSARPNVTLCKGLLPLLLCARNQLLAGHDAFLADEQICDAA